MANITTAQEFATKFQATGNLDYLSKAVYAIIKDSPEDWTNNRKVAALQLLADKGVVLEGNLASLILSEKFITKLQNEASERYESFKLSIRFEFIWVEGRAYNTQVPVLKQIVEFVPLTETESPIYESWQSAKSFWQDFIFDKKGHKRSANRVQAIFAKYPTQDAFLAEESDD
ncbi:hypothetical protein [Moorena sp. SIO3A2]|uniref:hypothetical protein n=1 Tax=Moorena sp. SIO3A2 TaxID=2607841 RepID=UPI0013BAB193|nr:hypothetical protein [Moorena sp. SIO3A2]NER90385.1 hypothetical protein [Moorena sp. SIO3A2]